MGGTGGAEGYEVLSALICPHSFALMYMIAFFIPSFHNACMLPEPIPGLSQGKDTHLMRRKRYKKIIARSSHPIY